MAEFFQRGDFVYSGLFRASLVIAAAALVFAAFFVAGTLSFIQAVAGFAVLSAAGLVAATRDKKTIPSLPPSQPVSSPTDAVLLDAVIAGLPDPVVALDRAGRVVAFNAPASQVAPTLRRGEFGLIVFRMPEVADAIRRATESGQWQRVEFSDRVPADRWFEVVLMPVSLERSLPTNRPDVVLMTFHDLTPLRRVEEMRADFVANASHELRTPLAALSGFIDTLQGPARDDAPARERFLLIMQAQATRMARLIDDLLSLSRIELNAHLRPETPVEVVPIVRQVADGLETLARDRKVKVLIHAPAEPLIVPGDRDELIRVFENLVENALKYGASGKRIEIDFIRGETPDGAPEAQVSVRDHGPGIAPEHLPRLTERFYRVDVADSRAQGGTGLGLALAKHILNRHRGRLSIASAMGQGATFTVHLPLG
jgi:two-component system phosphate regulon sensor histidine kinase PhoR